MKSTEKIHTIVESLPVEYKQVIMKKLLELRHVILQEVSAAHNNARKMVELRYANNRGYEAETLEKLTMLLKETMNELQNKD